MIFRYQTSWIGMALNNDSEEEILLMEWHVTTQWARLSLRESMSFLSGIWTVGLRIR